MELSEAKRPTEFLVSECPGTISRDQVVVTVGAGDTLLAGQVLGKLGSGKFVPFDETATSGEEAAAGVLYAPLDNSAGLAPADFDGVVINFGAEVRAADLEWGSADETVGLPQLAALGIKAR